MLQINDKYKQTRIKAILEETCAHAECLPNGIRASGFVSFEQLRRIEYELEFRIRQGCWYKCIKDVYDNTCTVCLFSIGEFYLSPRDNVLVADDNRVMLLEKWHKIEEMFEEVVTPAYK